MFSLIDTPPHSVSGLSITNHCHRTQCQARDEDNSFPNDFWHGLMTYFGQWYEQLWRMHSSEQRSQEPHVFPSALFLSSTKCHVLGRGSSFSLGLTTKDRWRRKILQPLTCNVRNKGTVVIHCNVWAYSYLGEVDQFSF